MEPPPRHLRRLAATARHLHRRLAPISAADEPAQQREARRAELLRAGSVPCRHDEESPLSPEHLEFFDEQGFLLLPSLLDAAHCGAVEAAVDEAVNQRPGGYHKRNAAPLDDYIPTAIPGLGALVTHPPIMAKVRSLMGGHDFALHHLHCYRHDRGCPGSNWHHVRSRLSPLRSAPRAADAALRGGQDHRHSVMPREHRMVYVFHCTTLCAHPKPLACLMRWRAVMQTRPGWTGRWVTCCCSLSPTAASSTTAPSPASSSAPTSPAPSPSTRYHAAPP